APYALDKPLFRQYLSYLGKVVHGDLGPSYKNKDFTVVQLIATGLPVSARLGLSAMALALPQTAIVARLMRGSMIEVLRTNYIRTARAKGLPAHRIVLGHALRAALLPLVSYLGPAVAGI